MRADSKILAGLLISTALLGNLSCGQKSKSDAALLAVAPSQPIVITGDFTFDNRGTQKSVKGPWFKFFVNLDNQTGSTLTVISLKVTVRGTDKTGKITEVESTYDPSMGNFTIDSLTCSYGTFGVYSAGENKKLHVEGSGSCPTGTIEFFAEGLPDPGDTSFFNYQVRAKVVGWFGTATNPEDRFEKTLFFTTQ